MTLDEIHREVQQVEAIKELTVKQIGFIAINGFAERKNLIFIWTEMIFLQTNKYHIVNIAQNNQSKET